MRTRSFRDDHPPRDLARLRHRPPALPASAPRQAKLARLDLDALLKALDGRLAAAPYLLGQSFSLTDLIVASVVWYGTLVGISLDTSRNVKAWLERCCERPQFKRSTQS